MKLTKKQTQFLKKRLDEKKALPTLRLDEEEASEKSNNEDSAFLKDIQKMDFIVGEYMKKQASRQARLKI